MHFFYKHFIEFTFFVHHIYPSIKQNLFPNSNLKNCGLTYNRAQIKDVLSNYCSGN